MRKIVLVLLIMVSPIIRVCHKVADIANGYVGVLFTCLAVSYIITGTPYSTIDYVDVFFVCINQRLLNFGWKP